MTPRLLAVAISFLLLPLATLPVGSALAGDGGGFTGTRLEGESYDRSTTYCDSFDGERAMVNEWDTASNGRYAFLPGTYCGIEFVSIAFPGPGRFTVARVNVEAPLGTTGTLRLNVHVDGNLAATAPFSFSDTARLHVLQLDATNVTGGAHTVSLTYSGSPYWVNLGIDYVDYEVSSVEEPPCTNLPPTVSVSANGMIDGLVGWAGFTYTFAAATSDGDGDALEVTWTSGNTTLGTGTTLAWSSSAVGAHVVEVTAREQRDRCGTGALSASANVTFQVRPDWQIALTQPAADAGCIERSPIPLRLVVGYCDFAAAVDAGADAPQFSFDSRFLLDGRVASADTSPTFSYTYDSLRHRGGDHQVWACAGEPSDHHGRMFCTDAYAFTSVGSR